MDLNEAYRECERITWSQARNFAYGIRLLPYAKRRGLAVIYAFARRIDDIGDGTLPGQQADMPPEHKLADLEAARQALDNLDGHDDPVLLALADVKRNFPIPMEAFGELIDGCVADVRGTRYETFEDLHHYCRCVAGSIGRLSLGIFGTRHDPREAVGLADSLGVALQLTNILRDVKDDLRRGRVYLPLDDLQACGCTVDDLAAGSVTEPVRRLLEFECRRAREFYQRAKDALPPGDRKRLVAAEIMRAVYFETLTRIERSGHDVFTARARVPKPQQALIALRQWLWA